MTHQKKETAARMNPRELQIDRMRKRFAISRQRAKLLAEHIYGADTSAL